MQCLLDVAERQAATEIAWIGPKAFYEKGCGARPGRRFAILEKVL